MEVEFEGGRGRLVAEGQRLVLNVDSASALTGLLDRRSLGRLARELARVGLTLHVRSGDRPIVSAGRDARTRLLGRALRLPNVQIDPRFAIRTVVRRRHRP